MLEDHGVNMTGHKKALIMRGLCCLLFIAFFLYFHWGSFFAPFERDEGEYAYSAWLLRVGRVPYKESFLQKPPLIIYTYALGQLISNTALWPPRALAAIFTVVGIVLTGLIARKLYGELAGWIAIYFAVPLYSFPNLTALAANTEKFMLPAIIALFLWHFVAGDKALSRRAWLGWGTLFALSFFYKPIGVVLLAFLCVCRLFQERKENNYGIRYIGERVFLFALGVTLVASVSLFYFYWTDSLVFLWEAAFEYNRLYAQVYLANVSLRRCLSILWLIVSGAWPIILCLLGACLLRVKHWLFLLICIAISYATVYSSPILHYYLLIMPFIAILAAGGLARLSTCRIKQPQKQALLASFLVVLSLCAIISPYYDNLVADGKTHVHWIYKWNNPFYESLVVADYIKQETKPEDKIFVAGSEPQIYYYAHRFCSNRFNITFPLSIETPKQLEYQRELLNNLRSDPPKMMVYSILRSSAAPINETLDRYREEFFELFGSKYVLEASYVLSSEDFNHGYLRIHPNAADLDLSSLFVYRRRD